MKHTHNHDVQFYESDGFLCSSVSLFIASGVQKGEAIIVVATQDHIKDIERRLSVMDVDSTSCKSCGQLTVLDADELLQKFMVNNAPNREAFFGVVGGLLAKHLASYPRLRVYGEMVDILSAAGNAKGTIALERLWNELAQQYTFSLLCGYSISNFETAQSGEVFADVCGTHSHVHPAESFTTLDNHSQLRFIAELQQKAIALHTEVANRRDTELALRRSQAALEKSVQELGDANKELKKANEVSRAKSILLATMSHEIRTPLTAIVGFAELMAGDPDMSLEERHNAIQVIIHSGKELTQLLNNILDLSKIESGRQQIEISKFSVTDLAADVSSVLGLSARQKGVHLEVSFDHDSAPQDITSDRTRLRQILLNLVGNSIKFTEQGTVKAVFRLVSSPHPGRSAILECRIQDTGCGIAPEHTVGLFELFVQGDSSMSRRYGGTGLGLCLSRQLARLLGGDLILADTTPGQGSTFVLTIDASSGIDFNTEVQITENKVTPMNRADTATRKAYISSNVIDEKANLYEISLLVVDDNMVNRRLLGRALERFGYHNIETASDGMTSLNMILERHFDIIFMDIQMPNMDGLTACQAIRKLYRDQKRSNQPIIIAFTAHIMPSDKDQCFAAGMDDYISKPIELAALREKLTHWKSHVFCNYA